MRLENNIFLVGSGSLGFSISNPSDCHVYLIRTSNGLVLIDTGMGIDTKKITDNIQKEGFGINQINTILITHHHGDHIGGLSELKKITGARVIANKDIADFIRKGDEKKAGLEILKKKNKSLSEYKLKPADVDEEVLDEDIISVGESKFIVISTPGHSDGHNSYLLQHNNKKYLFSGDCVFYEGKIMLLNSHDASVKKYYSSIKKLANLEFDALLPSHLSISLNYGKMHVQNALYYFDKGIIPPNIIY